ncbi:hypothetical protein AB0D62_33880 [Streptomyces massasporeus]|uniref:hypothetical protein n=1 Tax=Streptomyces massasporeus TaxID=67324 RepID=UPI0033FC0FC0
MTLGMQGKVVDFLRLADLEPAERMRRAGGTVQEPRAATRRFRSTAALRSSSATSWR